MRSDIFKTFIGNHVNIKGLYNFLTLAYENFKTINFFHHCITLKISHTSQSYYTPQIFENSCLRKKNNFFVLYYSSVTPFPSTILMTSNVAEIYQKPAYLILHNISSIDRESLC